MKARATWMALGLALLCNASCLSLFDGAQTMSTEELMEGVVVEVIIDGELIERVIAPEPIDVRRSKIAIIRFSREGYYSRSVYLRAETKTSRQVVSCLLSLPTFGYGFLIDQQAGNLAYDESVMSIRLYPESESFGLRVIEVGQLVIHKDHSATFYFSP